MGLKKRTALHKFQDDFASNEPAEWYLIQRLSTNISVLRNRLGSNFWTVLEHEEADSMFSRLAYAGDVLTDEMKQFIGWCKLPWNEVVNCMKKDEQVEESGNMEVEHEVVEVDEVEAERIQIEEREEEVEGREEEVDEREESEVDEVEESDMEVEHEVEQTAAVPVKTLDLIFLTDFYKRDLISYTNAGPKSYDPSSRNRYFSTWKKQLLPLFGPNPFKDMNDFFKNFYKDVKHPRVVEYRHCAMISLVRNLTVDEKSILIGNNWDILDDILKKICKDYMAESALRKSQEPLTYAEVPDISWEDIVAKVREFSESVSGNENASIDDIRAAILTRLYVIDNPPRRRTDYAILKLGNNVNVDFDNFYSQGMLVLNKYKTRVAYGKYEFEVTGKTRALIERIRSGYVFFDEDKTEEQMCSAFTDMTKRMFTKVTGKDLHANDLRKIHITTESLGGKNLLYPWQRIELAFKMGHSVYHQMMTYTVPLPPPGSNIPPMKENKLKRKSWKDDDFDGLEKGLVDYFTEFPEVTKKTEPRLYSTLTKRMCAEPGRIKSKLTKITERDVLKNPVYQKVLDWQNSSSK